jgi:hypothetical protein
MELRKTQLIESVFAGAVRWAHVCVRSIGRLRHWAPWSNGCKLCESARGSC